MVAVHIDRTMDQIIDYHFSTPDYNIYFTLNSHFSQRLSDKQPSANIYMDSRSGRE